MPQTLTVTEFARRLADYVNRIAYRGERFVLVRGKRRIAEIRPLPAGRRLSELPDLLASLPALGPADAERFSKDLADARDELGQVQVADPWRS